MTLLEHIKLLAQAYAKAKGIGIGRVSSLVFGDGNKLVLICQDRADLTTKRYEKAMVWFAENWRKGVWLDDVQWPSGVPKPRKRRAYDKIAAGLQDAIEMARAGQL